MTVQTPTYSGHFRPSFFILVRIRAMAPDYLAGIVIVLNHDQSAHPLFSREQMNRENNCQPISSIYVPEATSVDDKIQLYRLLRPLIE
jgi:hypothetical protein